MAPILNIATPVVLQEVGGGGAGVADRACRQHRHENEAGEYVTCTGWGPSLTRQGRLACGGARHFHATCS